MLGKQFLHVCCIRKRFKNIGDPTLIVQRMDPLNAERQIRPLEVVTKTLDPSGDTAGVVVTVVLVGVLQTWKRHWSLSKLMLIQAASRSQVTYHGSGRQQRRRHYPRFGCKYGKYYMLCVCRNNDWRLTYIRFLMDSTKPWGWWASTRDPDICMDVTSSTPITSILYPVSRGDSTDDSQAHAKQNSY